MRPNVAGYLDRKALVLDCLLELGGELQQSDPLGDPGAGFTERSGDRALRAVDFHEALQRLGFVQRVQVFVLGGSGESGLQEGVGVLREGVVDVNGYVVEAGHVGTGKSAVSVYDDVHGRSEIAFVPGVCVEEGCAGNHGEGLDDASCGEAVSHVFDGFEFFSGVERIVGDPPLRTAHQGRWFPSRQGPAHYDIEVEQLGLVVNKYDSRRGFIASRTFARVRPSQRARGTGTG
ncbi:hypothetical protein SAMN04487982_11099 [Streptomyces sp. ok210]|jgi:hypothetical protein|nr:hypothetical protein SAMN04487982_11099 [Streptomyces sp. ok210]